MEAPAPVEVVEEEFPTTVIPDHSLVESRQSLASQFVGINYSELADEFNWITEKSKTRQGIDLVVQAARASASILRPGVNQWEEISTSGRDGEYTLGRCRDEGVNSCFHRAVFVNLLAQQADIPIQTVDGSWVETQRASLTDRPDSILTVEPDGKGGALYVGTEDRTEGHLFNFAKVGEKVYLVDSAYLVEENGRPQPVACEIDYDPKTKEYVVPLADGSKRHYVVNGLVTVHTPQPTPS